MQTEAILAYTARPVSYTHLRSNLGISVIFWPIFPLETGHRILSAWWGRWQISQDCIKKTGQDFYPCLLFTSVISESKDGYPELEEKKDFILKVLAQEEEKFAKTIDQGLAILEDMEKEMIASGSKVLSGDNAFKLYDIYGFPMDLTSEILEEKGFTIDEDGFKKAMEVQRTTAVSYTHLDVYKRQDIWKEMEAEW